MITFKLGTDAIINDLYFRCLLTGFPTRNLLINIIILIIITRKIHFA